MRRVFLDNILLADHNITASSLIDYDEDLDRCNIVTTAQVGHSTKKAISYPAVANGKQSPGRQVSGGKDAVVV